MQQSCWEETRRLLIFKPAAAQYSDVTVSAVGRGVLSTSFLSETAFHHRTQHLAPHRGASKQATDNVCQAESLASNCRAPQRHLAWANIVAEQSIDRDIPLCDSAAPFASANCSLPCLRVR
jgi:hypothetical protein